MIGFLYCKLGLNHYLKVPLFHHRLLELRLQSGLERGEFKYVQLFMNYYWGKPKQITEVNVQEDIPMFQIEVVK